MSLTDAGAALSLKKQLEECKWKRRRQKSQADKLEEAVQKLAEKRREIEEGLQETASRIDKNVERLPSNCKFRLRYAEAAKARFLNPGSSEALEHTRESERTAKKRLMDAEDAVDALDKKIRQLEAQLQKLSKDSD